MSQTLTSSPARKKGLNLPLYLAIPLILLAMLAGAWLLWSLLNGQKPADLSQFEPNDSPATRVRARFFAQPTTARAGMGVVRREDGSGVVRIVGARANFTKAKAGGWQVNLAYLNQQFIPPADRQMIGARFIALTDAARRVNAGVTPQQVDQLRALKVVNEMVAGDAPRTTLIDLWSHYASAPDAERPTIEQKLTEALRQTALASMPATTTATVNYAKQIQGILSADQCSTLSGNAPPPRRAKTK